MDCRALTFRQLPHQPKLFLDYLERYERVREFYPHAATISTAAAVAREIAYPAERRRAVAEALRRQNAEGGSATREHLDRFERGAVAVVTGQQVGLLGGPAYAFYKALSAAQIARELTAHGVDAVPLFWMATEDHDVDEVRWTTFFDNGELVRLELGPAEEAARPVGRIRLGERAPEIAKIAGGFLESAGNGELAALVRSACGSEDTYASSFARLWTRLFEKQGLILADPLDPALHRVAAPIYQRVVAEREEMNRALLQRSKELESAGYEAQVKVTSKSALLFHLSGGGRHAITLANGKFRTPADEWTPAELSAAAAERPEEFSPNALLRPVVQDYLFPTAAYIGGPAEICYFAQSEVIYHRLLGRMPAVLPRADFTLVDAKAARLLRKYGLQAEDIWQGAQALRKRMEAASVPKDLARKFERDEARIAKLIEDLGADVTKLDSTLGGAVHTARRKIGYQMEKLKLKTGRALNERTGHIERHQRYLESLLYPRKALPSRELNLLPFLARIPGFLEQLQTHATAKQLGHHFIIEVQ